MSIAPVLAAAAHSADIARFVEARSTAEGVSIIAPSGMHPLYLAEAASRRGPSDPLVVVTATTREAEDLAAQIEALVPAAKVALFPAWETLPHERLSPRSDTVARRLSTLYSLAHPDETGGVEVLMVPVRALVQPMARGLENLAPVHLERGDFIAIDELVEKLVGAAYSRVDMVSSRGEFAVRGGIVDVFPPTLSHPVRLDFFGDELEEIRFFSVADQRSMEDTLEAFDAPACREILLTEDVRERARAAIAQLPGAADILSRLAEGIAVEGMESLTPLLVGEMVSLADLLPEHSSLVFVEPERIRTRVDELVRTTEEFLEAAWSSAAQGGAVPIDVSQASFSSLEDTLGELEARHLPVSTLAPFGLDADLTSQAKPHPGYGGSIANAARDLAQHVSDGWRIVLTTAGAGTGRHIAESLTEAGVTARFSADLDEELSRSHVSITTGPITEGILLEDIKLMLLCERDMTGKSAARRSGGKKLAARRRAMVDPLQLSPGDYVVHNHHGVGRFVEMTSRTVGTGDKRATREYLVIEYASSKKGQPGDRLYVPSDQLDQVTKYVGGEAPSVNKMGGSDWSKTKSRARKAIREIADELVRLYSERQRSSGFAFSPDTPWQHELEDAFEYTETPDQLSTIDDIKRDMEKPLPMDRLVCGDVGYGKTEVAVRAAFKAVQDGKQVAVLCPTTLLAQQHVDTFTERYAGFPVNVRGLSRFQTKAESDAVIEGLKDGSVDVVIGTHRLLTGQVRFKDLGLIIVDEEQRFGVEHKETLKALRTNVDVLSMSATPIPRTLEMAVTGIRELSTLATAPEERHPVLTYVGAHEDAQVKAAIRRELLREGQVFFIHNRVEDIERTAAHLRELVPDARVEVAHGKLNEAQLERVILDFWEKRFDVLVCTTIVETGLDISNANTLIVENADRFGLSQLHQLRGRVGRSRDRAYAYFLYPATKPLTETAHDRLTTLATHSELGAGMQVAMKDLEIRGAGNLLGGEQSGHIAGVGFDLYVRMVGEAVAAFKGEFDHTAKDTKVELPLNAHIPVEYIDSERLRLEAYSKISASKSVDELESVHSELEDRYGVPPAEVERLFHVARFRLDASEAGIDEVQVQGKMIRFAHVDVTDSVQLKLRRLYPGTVLKPALRQVLVPHPRTQRVGGIPLTDEALLEFCRGVIAQLKPAWAKERGIELAEQPSEPSRARSFGSRSPRASRLENSRRDAPQGTRQAGLGRKGHA